MSTRTKESGSNKEAFSCNDEIDQALRTKAKSLMVTQSALIRYGLLLAFRRLEKKSKDKARKALGIKT